MLDLNVAVLKDFLKESDFQEKCLYSNLHCHDFQYL
uniref:Uncharacterized protein n=1 Tax=Anguilla anguilla TaxID=7936 RepID=A0A0E9RSY7_ANGAN